MIEFSCTKCGKSFSAPDHYAGKKGRCQGCGARIDIPPVGIIFDDEPPPNETLRRDPEEAVNTIPPEILDQQIRMAVKDDFGPNRGLLTCGIIIIGGSGAFFGSVIGYTFKATILGGVIGTVASLLVMILWRIGRGSGGGTGDGGDPGVFFDMD